MQELLSSISGWSNWIQALSLVSGIVYMVMQIFQHKWMWYFGLVTAGAALVVALTNVGEGGVWAPLWAQVLLNGYFFIMDFVGIVSWKKIALKSNGQLHIVRLPRKHVLLYGIALFLGVPALCVLFSLTNDPSPVVEGLSFGLSILAQIFLTKSHLEQWYLWIVADIVAIIIYATQGAWFMVGLYWCYTANAFVGIWYWRNHGKYVE